MKPVLPRHLFVLLWPWLAAVDAAAESPAMPDDLPALDPWTWSGALRVGGGYKDNVELSAFAPVRSAFTRAEAEFFGWRLPDGVSEVQVFGAAILTRYTERTADQNEAQWFGRAEAKRAVGANWWLMGSLDGFHLDQFLDLSATEAERFSAKLQATGGIVAAGLRWEGGGGGWFEVKPSFKREVYRDGVADSRQPALRIGAGRLWAEGRGEFAWGGQATRQDFDDRRQYSLRGLPMPDTQLEFRQLETDLRLTWLAGADREWRWHTVLLAQQNRDNGPGYYDHLYTVWKQEVQWKRAAWRCRLLGRLGRYNYDRRPVSTAANAPVWRKNEQSVEVRLERRLGLHWLVYAEYIRERSQATNPNASFLANTALLGLEWTR